MKRAILYRFLLLLTVFCSVVLSGCSVGGFTFNFSPSTAAPILSDAAFRVLDLTENSEDIFVVAPDSVLLADDAVKLVQTMTTTENTTETPTTGHILVSILYNKRGIESQDVYDIKTGKAGLGVIIQGGETFESISSSTVDIDATRTRQITLVPLQDATTNVKISAKKGWQNTGIFLKRGRSFDVRYLSGNWTTNRGAVGTSDSAGQPINPPANIICNCGEPLPGYSTQAMIGQVGSGVGHTPLQIGDDFSGVSYDNAFLYLRMNLADQQLSHSDGSITVAVQTNNN